MTTENKCLGIWGWLFGHKYFSLFYATKWKNCLRCGKKEA